MEDILIPKNNEARLIEMAAQLGFTSLTLLYTDKKRAKDQSKKYTDKDIKIETALLFSSGKIQRPAPKLKIFIDSSAPNRALIEKAILLNFYNLENSERQDFIHHRNSGLNHILAELLSKNNHTLFISFKNLLNSFPVQRARKMGRISQNIRLARKFNFSVKIASFASTPMQMRAPSDLLSLAKVLGMDTVQIRENK